MAAPQRQFEPSKKRFSPTPDVDYSNTPRYYLRGLKACIGSVPHGMLGMILDGMFNLHGSPRVRITIDEFADNENVTPEAIYKANATFGCENYDPKKDYGDTPPLWESFAVGRGREYVALVHNIEKYKKKRPARTLNRKPAKSEGLEDVDQSGRFVPPAAEAAASASMKSAPPIAAFQAVAPNATNVTLPSGRTIPLTLIDKHWDTCPKLQKEAESNQQVTGYLNSSSGIVPRPALLASIHGLLARKFGKKIDLKQFLWFSVCKILNCGGVPDDVFLALVDKRKDGMRGYGMLRNLAEELVETYKARRTEYEELEERAAQNAEESHRRNLEWMVAMRGVEGGS